MTFVQLIMTGVFLGIAYFLLQVLADLGSHGTATQLGLFAIILVAIVVFVRKMFPG